MAMDLQLKLNQQGLRLTRPRRVVMNILQSTPMPLSPQTIFKTAVDSQEEISLVSVYRTLDLLEELSLVRKVHGHDGCHGYVLASPGHHHHIICQQCGRAVEFTGIGDLADVFERIVAETGFDVDDHLLQLYGLCPQCQKGKTEK
jgi:Fur family ferric uptake transcriptional regulator